MRWPATEELNALIRRYYAGEARLWGEIQQHVDDELRRRGVQVGAYHLRLRSRPDGGYDVQIDDAEAYAKPA
ncbi:hypothetical protein SE17_07335 [Kouleothrix aurantiaca]|uniref:Uncharacterized protein n=1 Tax=Kouleothrix aurantiaca TaxID=186479 RepID=A0A0P9D7K3_9CHLR|nr:hypothetical protein SE17_07335 [Kouleothrix aurantiaca]